MTTSSKIINTLLIATLPLSAVFYVPLMQTFPQVEHPLVFSAIAFFIAIIVIFKSQNKKITYSSWQPV